MDYDTFNGIASDAVIYVPFDSVDSYKKQVIGGIMHLKSKRFHN